MFKNKIVRSVIGVIESAVWEGQKNKGLELAPQALLEAGLFELLQKQGYVVYNEGRVLNDFAEIPVNPELEAPKFEQGALVGHLNKQIYEHAKSIAEKSDFMLNLGGDHSVAVGSIAGLMDQYDDDLKVIWIDAHPDCIQPDFSSYPYFHGMPLSQLFGWIRYSFPFTTPKQPAPGLRLAQEEAQAVQRPLPRHQGHRPG